MLSEHKLRKIAEWLRDACTDAGKIADVLDPARDRSQYPELTTRIDAIGRLANETACIADALIQQHHAKVG